MSRNINFIHKLSSLKTPKAGENIIVAVLDTGIDPGVPGLKTTNIKSPKIIDLIDCTGAGDIDISAERKIISDGNIHQIKCSSGITRSLPKEWDNRITHVYIGCKPLSQLINNKMTENMPELKKNINKIIVDIITFRDPNTKEQKYNSYLFIGNIWKGFVEDYTSNNKYYSITEKEYSINFTIKQYFDQKVSCIVFESGYHGTHVAGIIGAYFPDNKDKNGIAPSVQLVSMNIGDIRLDGLETTESLIRALHEVVNRKIHLINLSFGEPVNEPHTGILINIIEDFCKKYNITFVTSAGNSGPGLMTIGAPATSSSHLISVGAYTDEKMLDNMYYLNSNDYSGPYNWSSRGPTNDGDFGVDIIAPGGAITTISSWASSSLKLCNGTSMASPYVCGCLARIFSSLPQIPYFYWVKKHLLDTAKSITDDRLSEGFGLIQIDKCLNNLTKYKHENFGYDIVCNYNGLSNRGILIQNICEKDDVISINIQITPFFCNLKNRNFCKHMKIDYSDSLEDCITVPKSIYLSPNTEILNVQINVSEIKDNINANIYLCDKENDDYNSIIIPVNILIPDKILELDDTITKTIDLQPGIDNRLYILPKGDTINLNINSISDYTTVIINITQLLPQKKYNSQSIKKIINNKNYNNIINLNIESNNLIELCICQLWNNNNNGSISYTMTSYKHPNIQPNTLIINDELLYSYIEIESINTNHKCNINNIKSMVYPKCHTISQYKNNKLGKIVHNSLKDLHILEIEYIKPKCSGKYNINILLNNDIYESNLYRSGYITGYILDKPIIYGNHYNIIKNIDNIDLFKITFIGNKKYLESIINTPLIFSKKINLDINIYKSRKDSIEKTNIIQKITNDGMFFFRINTDNIKFTSHFDTFILNGNIYGKQINVIKNNVINTQKEIHEYPENIKKLNDLFDKLNPINYNSEEFNNDTNKNIIKNIEESDLIHYDNTIYPKVNLINNLCFDKNIQQTIFTCRKLEEKYPYIIYFQKIKKDNTKYLTLLEKHFNNNINDNFSKKQLYELKNKLSTDILDKEYYTYLIN